MLTGGKLTIAIKTENAAFDGDAWAGEVLRVLDTVRLVLRGMGEREDRSRVLWDANGNNIGEWFTEGFTEVMDEEGDE